jgi:hypothetical protein
MHAFQMFYKRSFNLITPHIYNLLASEVTATVSWRSLIILGSLVSVVCLEAIHLTHVNAHYVRGCMLVVPI